MQAIATDTVWWSVCLCVPVGHVREPCKTAEPIEMSFGVTRVGPRGQGRTNPYVSSDTTAMWPFVKIICPIIIIIKESTLSLNAYQ